MPTLELSDASLDYSEQGSGPPVVLVHGSASDARTWNSLVPALVDRWRVITYSRRYHAPNHPIAPGQRYDMQQHVDDLAALVDRLAGGRAHVVGHSYGAFVTLVLALQQPARVVSAVLAEPPVIPLFTGFPPRGERILALLLRRPRTALPVLRLLLTGLLPAGRAARRGDMDAALQRFGTAVLGADHFAAMPPERLAQARANVSREEMLGDEVMLPLTPESLAEVQVPVLLVTGEQSPPVFPRLSAHLETLLPDTRHVTIAGASHNMHETAPPAFNAAVRDFLGRSAGQAPADSR